MSSLSQATFSAVAALVVVVVFLLEVAVVFLLEVVVFLLLLVAPRFETFLVEVAFLVELDFLVLDDFLVDEEDVTTIFLPLTTFSVLVVAAELLELLEVCPFMIQLQTLVRAVALRFGRGDPLGVIPSQKVQKADPSATSA